MDHSKRKKFVVELNKLLKLFKNTMKKIRLDIIISSIAQNDKNLF